MAMLFKWGFTIGTSWTSLPFLASGAVRVMICLGLWCVGVTGKRKHKLSTWIHGYSYVPSLLMINQVMAVYDIHSIILVPYDAHQPVCGLESSSVVFCLSPHWWGEDSIVNLVTT